MGPESALPVSPEFANPEEYVESLLNLVTSSDLLKTLCGGVHILDFFTRSPDLYSVILPEEWRDFFRQHEIMHILDLFMREDLDELSEYWQDGQAPPPSSLTSYLKDVRRHSLRRSFVPINTGAKNEKLARNVALGMKVKKIHEVDHFSRYVEKLTADIAGSRNQQITHLVDFGSGQGYLPRCLASPPYNRHLIAVESKQHNIEGARNWDVMAKLAPKQVVMRDKKAWRAQQEALDDGGDLTSEFESEPKKDPKGERGSFAHPGKPSDIDASPATLQISANGAGSIQYIEHWIHDGNLSRVIDQIVDQDALRARIPYSLSHDTSANAANPFVGGSLSLQDQDKASDPRLMVISLHSCGNLVHHGIRSLLLNPAVSAVALVGCCYNLMTERLGPPTYKLPSLRALHPRIEETANAFDPHGFPMSDRLCSHQTTEGKGLRLNITARMMAVQAPYNWGKEDSAAFFTRHFFRALLQRVFLDLGIVAAPKDEDAVGTSSPLGWSGSTQPIIIGSLRKACYANFVAYVRGVEAKLAGDPERGPLFKKKLSNLSDDDIRNYADRYAERKKELSVVWSLMAFSAGVIEAVVVTDRWLFLSEQEEVSDAWVEPVFDYKQSPRNLVVVGIKR